MPGRTGPAMGWAEWAALDASALAALIRSGQVSARAAAAQAAAGMAMLDPKPKAILEVLADVIVNPDASGLAIGTRFHGGFAVEDMLLQVAAQIERAKPDWFGAAPPVHVAA